MSVKQRVLPVIVVGLDYSGLGDLALEHGLELVRGQSTAEIHVVNVAQGYGPMVSIELDGNAGTITVDEATAALKNHVEKRLAAFEVEHGALGVQHLVTHLRIGSAPHEIAELAKEKKATHVVVGTHGRTGVSRLLLGSVAESVVRLAPCSVTVIRPAVADEEPA